MFKINPRVPKSLISPKESNYTYICCKYFFVDTGLTAQNPDPVTAIASKVCYSRYILCKELSALFFLE